MTDFAAARSQPRPPHKGYENVAADRDAVTKVFTSLAVMEAIRRKGIKLISYADLN